jgi:outer membrane protein assembly factor BamB
MELWKYKLEKKYIDIQYTGDGKVYFKTDNQLLCLDIETGKEIWTFRHINMNFYISNGKIYIENHKDITTSLHCLDIETGKEIWVSAFNPLLDFEIAEKKIYIQDDKFIYCIDAESGKEIWKFSEERFCIEGFELVGDKIFIITDHDITGETHLKYIYSLKADTGEEMGRFNIKTGSNLFKGVSVRHVNNKKVLVVLNQEVCPEYEERNDILYYDEETGKEVWRFTDHLITDPWLHDIMVVDGERVYLTGGGYLYSLDLETGKEIWKFKTYSDCDLCISNKRIYAINKSGVYCLDTETGREIWKLISNLCDYYMPIVDGKVYVSTEDYIYCLDGETGREVWKLKLNSSSLLNLTDRKFYVKSEDYLYCLD